MNYTPAHLVGKQAPYLNRQIRESGLIAVVRLLDGETSQYRIIRCRRKAGELQGMVASGNWYPIVHMWNG